MADGTYGTETAALPPLTAAASTAASGNDVGDQDPSPPLVPSASVSSADDDDDENETENESDPLLADQVLAVVVTNVDAAPSPATGGVVSAASTALLLRGAQEHVVELVVTRRGGSHCVRRPLSDLVAVLQPLAGGAAPEFPLRQRGDDALIAKWCGDMTRFLAGSCDVAAVIR